MTDEPPSQAAAAPARLWPSSVPHPAPRPQPEQQPGRPKPAAAGRDADQALAGAGQAGSTSARATRTPAADIVGRGAPAAGAPRAEAARPAGGRHYRLVGAVVSVLALLTAASLVFALSRPARKAAIDHHTSAVEVSIRNQAATWVAQQVSPGASVSCDPVMCGALVARGVALADLVELRPGAGSPLGSSLIVATAAVRSQLGSRLSSAYAPAILASFGSGSLRIDVRVIAKHGAAAYMSDLRADVAARKASAATLLGSNRITLSAPARSQILAGQVDSRLVVLISNLAVLHADYIVAFGDSGPRASAGLPLRSVDLAQSGWTRRVSPAFVRAMLAFLRGPQVLYRPARMGMVKLAAGHTAFRIEYGAPSPLSLLGP